MAIILTIDILFGIYLVIMVAGSPLKVLAANTPVFSINKVSETDDEIVISINLDEGKTANYDFQLCAEEGYKLVAIQKSRELKLFIADGLVACSENINTGKVGASFVPACDLNGVLYTFTYTKNTGKSASSSDFSIEFQSCGDKDGHSVVPKIVNNISGAQSEDTTKPSSDQSDNVPHFVLDKESEKDKEIIISLSLVNGKTANYDFQLTAKEGYTLNKIEKSKELKSFLINCNTYACAENPANGKVGGSFCPACDLEGVLYTFTFTKAAGKTAAPSDFTLVFETCGNENGEKIIPMVTINENSFSSCYHKLSHTTIPSTCKKDGMEYDICTECGEIFNEKIIDKLAHIWDAWNITQEPTEKNNGTGKRVCSVCGATEDIELALNVDKNSKIQIMFPYRGDVTFDVKDETQTIGNIIKNGLKIGKLYDITMLQNNQPLQPEGYVTVKIPVPKNFDVNKTRVYHIIDRYTMEREEMPSQIDGNEKDGYFLVFRTNHFSYFAIAKEIGKVNSVSVSDITLNYKKSAIINPVIEADEGAEYTVTYESSNPSVARVDKNGKIYAAKKGGAEITVTVNDEYGNCVMDTCKVTVNYSFSQWLIVIVLFGWIWY